MIWEYLAFSRDSTLHPLFESCIIHHAVFPKGNSLYSKHSLCSVLIFMFCTRTLDGLSLWHGIDGIYIQHRSAVFLLLCRFLLLDMQASYNGLLAYVNSDLRCQLRTEGANGIRKSAPVVRIQRAELVVIFTLAALSDISSAKSSIIGVCSHEGCWNIRELSICTPDAI